jgi:hypothetical protein
MEEKSLSGLFSQLIPDEIENSLGLGGKSPDEQNSILVGSLKVAAGQSGGAMVTVINEFLSGQGDLLETTRAAVTRSGSSASKEIATLLTTQFKLAPTTAQIIAALLVKLFPSIKKAAKSDTPTKKKPRRKAKPKTAASAKKDASSAKKKPKKKTPKATPTKPAAKKKKAAAKTAKKEAKPAKKPKKAKRVSEISVNGAGTPEA